MSLLRYNDFLKLNEEQIFELTISPYYQQKGISNPFYILGSSIDTDVKKLLNVDLNVEIKYKNVEEIQRGGKIIKDYGGATIFQIYIEDEETDNYIKTTKKKDHVVSHYGMKSRKDSTASSNINEILSLYFLIYPNFVSYIEFINEISLKKGPTGILVGTGMPVNYELLNELIDADETAERDIMVGYQNSLAIKNDIGDRKIKNYFWTPRQKPHGISPKHPSDIVLEFTDGTFIGYSNKFSQGKDATPKLNTNIVAFITTINDDNEQEIKKMIDSSWTEAANTIDKNFTNAYKAIREVDITKEDFTERNEKSIKTFSFLATEFSKDGLDFYTDGFYYKFRNNLILKMIEYLKNPKILTDFLNAIGVRTFPDTGGTPCPYKLLIGSTKGSEIKNVSTDEDLKQILLNTNPSNIDRTNFEYGNGQSFVLSFNFKPTNSTLVIPLILRTRTAGGWSGKNLYITATKFNLSVGK